MITRRTVIILGAGASKPYGLPLGPELRDDVVRLCGELGYSLVLKSRGGSAADITEFAKDLATSGFSSVDAFLEQRPRWLQLGKVAMALSLLAGEFKTAGRLFPPNQPRDHWYQVLWGAIQAPTYTAFREQPLAIVTFNYDRSLEHYLANVLSNHYAVTPAVAAASLPLLHVHGSLGHYTDTVFGKPISDPALDQAAQSIRVVHETDMTDSYFAKARDLIGGAEKVLFLGFGYLPANMRKLGFPLPFAFPGERTVVGTHKGIKARAWEQVCNTYRFPHPAKKQGVGSISEFVSEWLT